MTPRLSSSITTLIKDLDLDPTERAVPRRLLRVGAAPSVRRTPDRPQRESLPKPADEAVDPGTLAAITHRVDPDAVLALIRR
jgi:hypothetical protein